MPLQCHPLPRLQRCADHGKLAQTLGRPYWDTDELITEKTGLTPAQLIEKEGEKAFRAVESQVIEAVSEQTGAVIATGGGCVTRKANLPILRQNGIIVWIRRSVSALSTEGRPLSQNGSLKRMYQIREPLYRSFADIIVDNDSTPEETASQIMKQLEDIQ